MGGSEISGPYGEFLTSINIFTLDAFQVVPFDCVGRLDHLGKLCVETLIPIGTLGLAWSVKVFPLRLRGRMTEAFTEGHSLLTLFFHVLVLFLPTMYETHACSS